MAAAKKATLRFELPDGTKLSVEGPMAEVLARRILTPAPAWYPCYPLPAYHGTWSSPGYVTHIGGGSISATNVTSGIYTAT